MRWIFQYNEQAAKYLGKILKKKMPKTEPWLHVAIKTMSKRNPWSGAVIYIWDTREVVWEYRSNKDKFTTDMFKTENCHMRRALDNRQPLVGGRNDINEFFEFGADFDASHGAAFDGKDRKMTTKLYKRRAKKAGIEAEFGPGLENYNKKVAVGKTYAYIDHATGAEVVRGEVTKIAKYGDMKGKINENYLSSETLGDDVKIFCIKGRWYDAHHPDTEMKLIR